MSDSGLDAYKNGIMPIASPVTSSSSAWLPISNFNGATETVLSSNPVLVPLSDTVTCSTSNLVSLDREGAYGDSNRTSDNASRSNSEEPATDYSSLPDIKVGFQELCPVCGDKVSGYHYGLLTCESCKGFFKRTVQNKKVYSCVDNQECHIDKTQRKRCPSCRFQKCIQVGMKLEAVRTDRMRGGRNKFGPLYKRDRAMKLQTVHSHNKLIAQYQMSVMDGYQGNDIEKLNSLMGYTGAASSKDYNQPPFTNPLVSSYVPGLRVVPPLLKEFQDNEIDSMEMHNKMSNFLRPDISRTALDSDKAMLALSCRIADQLLLILVEWARGAVFFKEIKVEDQMRLLQACWSELIIIDFVYRLIEQNPWPLEAQQLTESRVGMDLLDRLNLSNVKDRLADLLSKLQELQFDNVDYSCMKFLILLNPDVTDLQNRQIVEQSQEKVNAALLDYCIMFFPSIRDKFGQLLLRLPEIRIMSIQLEEFLYFRHSNSDILPQSLLMEMLRSKRV